MAVKSSRPIAHVARELNMNETTLDNWVKEYRETHADDEPVLPVSKRAQLRDSEPENRELKMKVGSFQKPRCTSQRSIGNLAVRIHRAARAR